MKKLFFYANVRTYDSTVGITRKVFEQINAFRELNYDVEYSGYTKDGVAIFNNENSIIIEKKYFFNNEKINYVLRRYMLLWLCCKYVKNKKFDVAYLRYHFFDFLYIKLLKLLERNGAKNIIEAHAYPVFPKGFRLNPIKILDDFYSKKASRYCDLIAAMTNFKLMWNIPTYEIDNTLDISSFTLKKQSKLNNNFIMVNIAFENVTHGLDRVLYGIKKYKEGNNKYNIKLYLIGEYRKATINLIETLNLNENVFIEGKKNKNEIDMYIDEAHIAIGSLGNHRANSFYGSALKTKEYMARGIPFIYGWNERVLKNFQFGFKVELNEEAVDIAEIIEKYKGLESPELNLKIREYLKNNNLTWKEQFENLTSIIK